jgi:tRNA threonylcarbamoyladenosine biosynthesis protein TsaE
VKKVLPSNSPKQTEIIAEKIGARLKGGEVIELVSDLGGGKTTFVRSLVRAVGSSDHVSSPTFTISNLYKTKKCDIHHIDLYRLHEAGLIEHELRDILTDKNVVVVVEWSDVVKHVLPEERLSIHIQTTGDETRELELSYPESLQYLMKNL